MRVVFSRKGFDSASGGCPSPIIEGRPFPLPIPTGQPTRTTYGDLVGGYAEIVYDLTGGKLTSASPCHLDPDIDASCLPRAPEWRGAFGQVSAALTHLKNQKVGVGDIFLFWGCFRDAARRAGRWKLVGPARHLIFGWLQVGSYHDLSVDGSPLLATQPWLTDHPHVRPGWGTANAIFLSADTVSVAGFTGSVPGYGILRQGFEMSKPNRNPSVWAASDWLHPGRGGCGMSYHSADRWFDDGTLQCVGRGQEFVADVGNDGRFGSWLTSVVEVTR